MKTQIIRFSKICIYLAILLLMVYNTFGQSQDTNFISTNNANDSVNAYYKETNQEVINNTIASVTNEDTNISLYPYETSYSNSDDCYTSYTFTSGQILTSGYVDNICKGKCKTGFIYSYYKYSVEDKGTYKAYEYKCVCCKNEDTSSKGACVYGPTGFKVCINNTTEDDCENNFKGKWFEGEKCP